MAKTDKRIILSGVIVCIVVLTFSSLFIYNELNILRAQVSDLQFQNSQLENQNNELRSNITALENQIKTLQEPTHNLTVTATSSSSWINPGGIWYIQYFNITIQNKGLNNVGGVTLDYTVVGNQTNIPYEINVIEMPMGIIHAGETVSGRLLLGAGLQDISALSNCRLALTLILDGNVLSKTQTLISNNMSPIDNP